MDEILLSSHHNMDKRSIPWFKQYVADMDTGKIKALETNCRVQWHRYYYKVLEVICKNFDRWNAGALRIDQALFRSEFSYIKDPRTYYDLLDLMKSSSLLNIWKVGKDIVIHSPVLEKSTEQLVKRYRERWKDSGKRTPKQAGKLLEVCKKLAGKNAKT